MALAVAWLLFLQLVLGPTLAMDINLQTAIKNFRDIHIDYPKINYPVGFHGYCNGLMAYVRGKEQRWYCPNTHYIIHAPWTIIRKFCKYCESFCENYNEYCTLTQDTFPLTVCSLVTKQPPTSCRYNGTLTNQRLYLLCSRKYDAEPIDSCTHPRSRLCPVGSDCPSTGPDPEFWMEAQSLSSHHGNRHPVPRFNSPPPPPFPSQPSSFPL